MRKVIKHTCFILSFLLLGCGDDDVVRNCFQATVITEGYQHCHFGGINGGPGPLSELRLFDADFDTVLTYLPADLRVQDTSFYASIIQVGDTLICTALVGATEFLHLDFYASPDCAESSE